MKVDYFYSAQTERVIKHLIRMFSGFRVQDGVTAQGEPTLRRVPCRFGDISRQSAVALHGNSENMLPSAPFMTVNIQSLNLSRGNVRAPMTEQTVMPINKKNADGQYINELDAYYEVERHNPVPWDLEFSVDIWTTNQQNKFELFEQIATLFAPSCPLQLSTNPTDWTASSDVELTGYTHTSRSFPQGTDHNLDISTFTFKTMVWYSLPARVDRANLIHQIVTNIKETKLDEFNIPSLSNWQTVKLDSYTPGNHMLQLEPTENAAIYKAKLLSKLGNETIQGQMLDWSKLFKYYSADATNAQLRLVDMLENDQTQIVGSIVPSNVPNEAVVTIDMATLDATTSEPISGFIDPTRFDTSTITSKTRYVVHESVTTWDEAEPGSIIEFDPVTKKFTAIYKQLTNIVVNNLKDGKRYKYSKGIGWQEVVKHRYQPGYWRLGFRAD